MQMNAINHDMTAPEGAVPTGEMFNGRQVYRMEVEVVGKLVQRRDPISGEPMWHLKDGQKTRPMTEREPSRYEEREFVLEPVGNGNTQINYDFRPSAQEMASRAARAAFSPEAVHARLEAQQAETEAVKSVLADLGVTPEMIAERMAERAAEPPKAKRK